MKKRFLESWETYAKRLELDVKELERNKKVLEYYDFSIGKHLRFPTVDSIIDYIKAKQEINHKFSAQCLRSDGHITPTEITHMNIRFLNQMKDLKETYKSYILEL